MKKLIVYMMLALFSVQAFSQDFRPFKGKVTDTNGSPISGVVITTDQGDKLSPKPDGTFLLKVPTSVKKVTFSADNFEPVDANVDGSYVEVKLKAMPVAKQAAVATPVVDEAAMRAEIEAQVRAEYAARAEAEARIRAEVEAQVKAEAEAKIKAEAEAKAKAEAEAKAQAEAKAKAEAEAAAQAKAKAEAEAKLRAEAEAKIKAEAEAKAKAEAEAQAAAAKAKAEAEAKAKAEAEAKAKAEAEAAAQAKAKAEAAAKAKAEAEAAAAKAASAAQTATDSSWDTYFDSNKALIAAEKLKANYSLQANPAQIEGRDMTNMILKYANDPKCGIPMAAAQNAVACEKNIAEGEIANGNLNGALYSLSVLKKWADATGDDAVDAYVDKQLEAIRSTGEFAFALNPTPTAWNNDSLVSAIVSDLNGQSVADAILSAAVSAAKKAVSTDVANFVESDKDLRSTVVYLSCLNAYAQKHKDKATANFVKSINKQADATLKKSA